MTISVHNAGAWANPVPYVRYLGTWYQPNETWVHNAGIWSRVGHTLVSVTISASPLGSVVHGTTVTLTANTTDQGYGTLTYAWTRTSGTNGVFTGSTTAVTCPVQAAAAGTSVFQCVVTDPRTSSTATNTISVTWT